MQFCNFNILKQSSIYHSDIFVQFVISVWGVYFILLASFRLYLSLGKNDFKRKYSDDWVPLTTSFDPGFVDSGIPPMSIFMIKMPDVFFNLVGPKIPYLRFIWIIYRFLWCSFLLILIPPW